MICGQFIIISLLLLEQICKQAEADFGSIFIYRNIYFWAIFCSVKENADTFYAMTQFHLIWIYVSFEIEWD